MPTAEERFWTEILFLMKECEHWFTQPRKEPVPLNCRVCGRTGNYIETPATMSIEKRKQVGLYIKVPRATI